MLSRKMADAVNKQINAELYSAYLYLSMQTYFDKLSLPGFSNWMRVQAMEEFAHADRFWQHLVGRGARVTMTAIEGPPAEWDSPLAVFEAVYAHEQMVTGLISALADLATAEKDHTTLNALQWFLKEQEEEEESADAVVRKLKDAGDSTEGLAMIDRELATRVFTPPAAAAQ